MPFIALPFIFHIVGSENYGIVVFAQSVVAYFLVFINFGLDISAVRDVSINRDNKVKLNEIVSSILCIKVLLFIFSFLSFAILVFLIPIFKANSIVFYFAYLMCFADILFPVWYFQGIEKMKVVTFIRLIAILFYVVALFLFLKVKEDFYLIPLFQSLGLIISGIVSLYIMIMKEQITYYIPPKGTLLLYFKESIPYFSSRISVVINNTLAKLVSGFFFSMHDVAVFDLAQKITTAAFVPIQMLNQSIFPHNSKHQNRKYANDMLWAIGLTSLFFSLFIFLIAPYIVYFFAKDQLPEATTILRILCIYIFSGGVSLYTGSPVLVAFGYSKPFNYSVILSTFVLISLYAVYYLLGLFSIYNFALALGLSELTIAVYRLVYCYKFKIFVLNGKFRFL